VQSFMGFANFYCQFTKGFSKIAKPLTDLTKKGIKWTWTPSCQDAFDKLKEMFTTGPILTHFDDPPSARKISLHPMHPMLLKASGDRNEGRKSKNDNLPKRVS